MKNIIEYLNNNRLAVGLFCLTVAIYALLFGIYITNDVDNTWTTAWVYSFWYHGNTHDVVFYEGNKTYWGVRFFSHIFCYVYGAVLAVIGYTKNNVHMISLFFIVMSLVCWKRIADMLFNDSRKTLVFVFMLAWSGVVFTAANKARSDSFVFFLMSLSLLLLMKRRYFFSMLIACVAVETHPIGLIAFFYLAAYVIFYDRELLLFKNKRSVLWTLAGVATGSVLYFILHGSELKNLSSSIEAGTNVSGYSNFLAVHFWGRTNFRFRYWPELAMFISAFFLHFAVFRKKYLFFPVMAIFVVLSSFILKRANCNYAVFAYPAFLLLTVHAFGGLKIKFFDVRLLVAGWLFLMLPQYLYVAWKNSPGRYYSEYVAQLNSLDLPKNAKIYGMPLDWFGFYRYEGFRSLTGEKKFDREHIYVLKHEGTIFSSDDVSYDFLTKDKYEEIASLPLKAGGKIKILKLL